MINIIEITEQNNKLELVDANSSIVCGNSNYMLKFNFSDTWQDCIKKTAFFIVGDNKITVDFENNQCFIPTLPNAEYLIVSLFSSLEDKQFASTMLKIKLIPTISAGDLSEYDQTAGYLSKLLGTINKIENGDIVADTAKVSLTQVDLRNNQNIEGIKNFIGNIQKNNYDILNKNEISNDNILINGDFKINQRGKSSYSGSTYGVDRWKLTNSNTTISTSENGIILSGTETDNAYINQIVENGFDLLGGKFISFSISINGQVYSTSGKVPTERPASTKPVATISNISPALAVGVYIQNSGKFIVQIGVSAGNSIEINWAKLELGEHSTRFEPCNAATELAKCQRFYEKIDTSYEVNKKSIVKLAKDTKSFYDDYISFKTTKRTPPTVHCYSTNDVADNLTDNTSYTDVAVKYVFVSANGFRVYSTVGGFTANSQVLGYFEADAEIY